MLLPTIKMAEKDFDKIDEGVEQTPKVDKWPQDYLAEELRKPSREDIPSSYKSWESSSLSKWSYRDVEYVYGEWKDDIVWAVLVDYSYYPGWWCWMEYWVKLFVKRWDWTDMERIVYRDSYSAARDDRWKAYTKIEWIEVDWDRVTVKVSSSRKTGTYSFFLKKPDKPVQKEEWLSQERQDEFKEHLVLEKERLLEEKTRHEWKYPVFYDLTIRQTPNAFTSDKSNPYAERPYDKAEIIDESVDLEKWIAYIVIKTQIDANADSWKQFQWLKFKITPEETTLVESDQAYQSQLADWKEISIRAN